MLSKVEAADSEAPGLLFIKEVRDEILSHSDWNGMQHNSRSGFAAYYRYKPRNIGHLCQDPDNGVSISTPKIHRAVLERIKGNSVAYAPTGLPADYQVVVTRGNVPSYETPTQSTHRANASNAALDVIYWRRWLYRGLLLTTITLLASRFFLDWTAGGICKDTACVFDPLMQLAMSTLPDFASGWFEVLRQKPPWLWGLSLAFLLLFTLKWIAPRKTQAKATAAWSALKGDCTPARWTPTLKSRLRDAAHSTLRTAARWLTAGSVLAVILFLLLAAVSYTTYYVRSTFGALCQDTDATPLSTPRSVMLDISTPCFATGIAVQEGQTYRFNVSALPWADGEYAASPNGITPLGLAWAVPFR